MHSLRLASRWGRAAPRSLPLPERLSLISYISVSRTCSPPGSSRNFITIPGASVPEEDKDGTNPKKEPEEENKWRPMLWKMLESTATTLASVAVLGYGSILELLLH